MNLFQKILLTIKNHFNRPEQAVGAVYCNHRGETAHRVFVPEFIWFGSTEWHPKEQWLLRGYDLDKAADRDYSLEEFFWGSSAKESQKLVSIKDYEERFGMAVTVGGGLSVYGSYDAIKRVQDYICLDSGHPLEEESVNRSFARALQEAEAKLNYPYTLGQIHSQERSEGVTE